MNYETIKLNYERGLWNELLVNMALKKGVITKEEYDQIVGKN